MKKKLLGLVLIFTISLLQTTVSSNEKVNEDKIPKLQIGVISDIHLGEEKESKIFINALNDYKNIAPNCRALAIVGDFTNHGLEFQYDEFKKVLDKNISSNVEKIVTIGNHEFYERRIDEKSKVTDNELKDRFVNKTGMPGVYYDKWIDGYHFIALGSEESMISNPKNEDSAIISEEQYSWLEKTLAVNKDNKNPIFMFLHQPISDTVYGSEYCGGLKDGRLLSLLKQYPQVILFSGHSHFLLNHPRTIYQDGFTMVNTASVAYTWFEGGEGASQYSQGLLLDVYKDRVEIKSRDFTSHNWINTHIVKIPYEENIKDTTKPTFPSEAKVTIDEATENSITLSWDAAEDDTLVDKYYIKKDGEVIETKYIKFWENKNEKTVSITLANLSPGTEYNIEIYAVDAWGNQSLNPLKVIPRTK